GGRGAARLLAVCLGSVHEVVHACALAAHVELEEAQRRRRSGLLEPGLAYRGEHLRDAELRGGTAGGGSAALDDRLEPADRREEHRQPGFLLEKGGAAVDRAHVAQHARSERDRIERLAVALHRGLGLGAADQIAPRPRREVALRGGDDLLEGEELFRVGGVHASFNSSAYREASKPTSSFGPASSTGRLMALEFLARSARARPSVRLAFSASGILRHVGPRVFASFSQPAFAAHSFSLPAGTPSFL